MIKISIPPVPVNVYIKYSGSRLNLVQRYNAFEDSRIEFEKTFKNIKETITVKVKLFDDKIYHLGLISRNIYTEVNNELIQFENGFLMHNEIILNNDITFISARITMDVEVNGELINESYSFKVFIKYNNSKINKYIVEAEIECDNFIK
ncbi:hypothetical protein [Flavobacterium sp. RSSB_23]|uniref:hypothetical protein n=1 Tax=Flavobacterium sp. RSSB_23 TaxID=3447668 RepID=UPI003F2C1762